MLAARRCFALSPPSSVPLVLKPSRGSEMEIDPCKASEDEDWLGSDVSSPKDTPLCLDYVPYEQRSAMEVEREGNHVSEPSSLPEKEDWEAKWDDEDCRWGRWNHMSQRRTNGFFMDTEREEKSISIFDMNGLEEEEPAPRWYNGPRWEQRPPWPYHRENRIRIIESTGVGAGLKNLGNTCFINAIL